MLGIEESNLVRPKDDSLAIRNNPITNGKSAVDKISTLVAEIMTTQHHQRAH